VKISTKGRYALRLMLDLAVNDTGEYLSLKSIAARQEISDKYLEQIISLLSRGGFVRSVRGAQGGYRLAKSADQVTVGMILRLTEGSLSPVPCLDEEPDACSRSDICVTREVWQQLADAINGVVDHITLADLAKRQRAVSAADYQI
jgi:Rrf2 family protein